MSAVDDELNDEQLLRMLTNGLSSTQLVKTKIRRELFSSGKPNDVSTTPICAGLCRWVEQKCMNWMTIAW